MDTTINLPVGLKVGSTYACASVFDGTEQKNIVIKSCVRHIHDPITNEVKETIVGEDTLDAVFPLDKGIIESDDNIAPVIAIIERLGIPKFARVVAAVPAVEILNGKERLKQAINSALAPRKLVLFPEVFCGAVNALGVMETGGEKKLKALNSNFAALNLGSTTTEVLISQNGSRKYLNAFANVSGNRVDHVLYDKLQNTMGKVIITLPMVREIKEGFDLDHPHEVKFNVLTKNGMREEHLYKPVQDAISRYIEDVAELLKSILVNTLDIDTIAEVLDTPIVLTGGMGNIKGLPEHLEKKLREVLNYQGVSVLKQADGHIAPSKGALALTEYVPWEKVM